MPLSPARNYRPRSIGRPPNFGHRFFPLAKRQPSNIRFAGKRPAQALLHLLLAATFASNAAPSGPRNENLIQTVPSGYKIGYTDRAGNIELTEMIPQSESVENWTEMVTTHVVLGAKDSAIQRYKTDMRRRWEAACANSEFVPVRNGTENGYVFDLWLQSCPRLASSGKPEITWFKAIAGNDSLYVVQKAFRFEPSKEQVIQWTRYLRDIVVCDSRLKDRACDKFIRVAD